jgi:universal stress protein A
VNLPGWKQSAEYSAGQETQQVSSHMYRKVLVAVELASEPATQVLQRARALHRDSMTGDDTFAVVHVVEPQYIQYSFDPTFTGALTRSMEEEAVATAARRVAELCEPFGIPTSRQFAVLGRPASRIHELALREGCDLIIVGSHGRAGLRALLGSTANAVLHGSPVDVMTVRLHEPRQAPEQEQETAP